jgi:hypothetical protein
LLFAATLCCSMNASAVAQDRSSVQTPGAGPSTSQTPATPPANPQEAQKPPTSEDEKKQQEEQKKKEEQEKKDKDKKQHRGSLVFAPLPISSPAIGLGATPAIGYIFPFSKDDKISPPSVIGAAGLVTDNGTSGFGIGAQLYMKEDTYEITSFYAHGDLNYNLYGTGFFFGNAGMQLKLPLNQTGQIFFGEFLRRIKWKFLAGPRFVNGDSVVTLRPTNEQIPNLPPDLGLHTTLRSLGFRVVRDTRPNRFFPTSGMKLNFTADFFSQGLGSKYSFQSYKFTFNKYYSLAKNQVLAYDLFICNTAGQPPFYGNCVYGTQSELRGYTAGQYLDTHMFTTQLEYRLTLPKGFGLAVFGGLGGVVPGSNQVLRDGHFLPDIGGGPRYELSKKYHVNLRTDFARGVNSWTWTVGVGEAF